MSDVLRRSWNFNKPDAQPVTPVIQEKKFFFDQLFTKVTKPSMVILLSFLSVDQNDARRAGGKGEKISGWDKVWKVGSPRSRSEICIRE